MSANYLLPALASSSLMTSLSRSSDTQLLKPVLVKACSRRAVISAFKVLLLALADSSISAFRSGESLIFI